MGPCQPTLGWGSGLGLALALPGLVFCGGGGVPLLLAGLLNSCLSSLAVSMEMLLRNGNSIPCTTATRAANLGVRVPPNAAVVSFGGASDESCSSPHSPSSEGLTRVTMPSTGEGSACAHIVFSGLWMEEWGPCRSQLKKNSWGSSMGLSMALPPSPVGLCMDPSIPTASEGAGVWIHTMISSILF